MSSNSTLVASLAEALVGHPEKACDYDDVFQQLVEAYRPQYDRVRPPVMGPGPRGVVAEAKRRVKRSKRVTFAATTGQGQRGRATY